MVAVVITGLTTSLLVLGGTRLLEGAATAASRALDPRVHRRRHGRRRAAPGPGVARFEAATLAGLLVGVVVGGSAVRTGWDRSRSCSTPGVYAVSFAIYRFGVRSDAEPARAPTAEQGEGLGRYLGSCGGGHVWLLAPTWIAINADLGLFTTQTMFQLVKEPDPQFADQR